METPSLPPDPTVVPPPGRDELAAWLRLTLTHGVGPATALTLLGAFGSPRDVLAATHAEVSRVAGRALATRLVQPDPEVDEQVRRSLEWANGPGCHLLTLADPAYPRILLDIPDPPPLLFVRGLAGSLQHPAIAMVGSRHASLGGRQTAAAFARNLAAQGLTIISGLATGIDTAAHQGSLEGGGLTLAVLGTGIDRIYPAGNRALAGQIASQGALISEFPLGAGPMRANFPRRNRLIAGLAGGVLVVEAARRSGSLITARLAGDFGRDVFAIPGSIHSPLARGCHQLIRDGARLVESADDIISELRPDFLLAANRHRPEQASSQAVTSSESAKRGANNKAVGKNAAELLDAMGWDPVSYDSLALTGLVPLEELDATLLELELSGHLERFPDGRLRRLPA